MTEADADKPGFGRLSSGKSLARLPVHRGQARGDQQPCAGLRDFATGTTASAGISLSLYHRAASARLILSDTANAGERRRRDRNPRSAAERINHTQRQRWSQSRRSRTVEQCGLERDRRIQESCAGGGENGLVKLCGRGFCRGSRLLGSFFHAIGTARACSDLAIGNHRLALLQRDSVPRPVDPVADTIRKISGSRQNQAHDVGMIVIEARVMRRDHRIVLCHPLQLARISHSTGHDGIGIDRTALDLAQGFLLSEQKDVAAGLDRLAIWRHRPGRSE